jgi:hypothetical protein
MAGKEVKPMGDRIESASLTALVDVPRLRLETVDAVVNWAHDAVSKIEKTLDHYYVDSLEIDLGAPPGVKLVIKNKAGQSTGFPRT